MKKFSIQTLFFILLLVVYIYSVVFIAFPISTKILLEGIGLIYCLKYILNNQFVINKEYLSVFRIIAVILLWDLIICFLKGSSEFHYVQVILPIAGSIFGAQLLYEYSHKVIKNINGLMALIVITVFLESLLSILMRLMPGIYDTISSFLVFELGKKVDDIFTATRLYGIGNAIYFGVLPSCTIGVMSSVYLLTQNISITRKILVSVMWMVISIVSFLTARTCALVIAMSVLYLFLSMRSVNLIKRVGFLIGLLIVGFFVIAFSMSFVDEEIKTWAFAFFEGEGTDDGSAGIVMSWWEDTKFDTSTLFFGDAHYENKDGSYYKRVDIGFFRQIFYGGLIGLFLNLYLHFKILKMSYKRAPSCYTFMFLSALFISYLLILAKGDSYVASFFILYLVFLTEGAFRNSSLVSHSRKIQGFPRARNTIKLS